MDKLVEQYGGISPGSVLERVLGKKHMRQSALSRLINVRPQTVNAIIKGHRRLTSELALKIDYALDLQEGTMYVLQALYDTQSVKKEKKLGKRPSPSAFRRVLFWDTDYDKIDWEASRDGIIRRVMERGNEAEKTELLNFYGKDAISEAINKMAG